MEDNKTRRLIIISLASLLIGSLLFIFGLSLVPDSILPLCVNTVISIVLYTCVFLAVKRQNQDNPQRIYKYIMVLTIYLLIIVLFASLSTLYSHL